MRRWLISLPAWGNRYIDLLCNLTIPSLAACDRPETPMLVVVHTNEPDRVRPALEASGLDYEIRELPRDKDGVYTYVCMSHAHSEVIAMSKPGDYLTLMCADVMFSRESFIAAEARFQQGYKAVTCIGTRTVGPLFNNPPPLGYPARDLLDWSMRHRHPIIVQSFWGYGKTTIPSQIYFEDDSGVVARVFTPCLFGVVSDGNLTFKGTIDFDLLKCFDRSEIYVVTGRDELAVVEVSPFAKNFGYQPDHMTAYSVARWTKHVALDDLHYWFFNHRMEITGPGGTYDQIAHDSIVQEYAQC